MTHDPSNATPERERPVSSRHPQPRILIVGGPGFFGRLLIEDLLRHTSLPIIIASRRIQSAVAARSDILLHPSDVDPDRLSCAVCDLNSPESVDAALAHASVAVCAAGPYQHLPLTLVQACVHRAIPYLDLADQRDFVRRLSAYVADQPPSIPLPPICTAWSTVSALSCALARIASTGWTRIDTLHVMIAPGNRQPRAYATVASLLESVARPFDIPCNGQPRRVIGWSEPRPFTFPTPIGPRPGWLVDTADHDLAPSYFNTGTVEFRVGAELPLLNRSLSALAFLRRHRLAPPLTRWNPALRAAIRLFSPFGTDSGAVGVELTGLDSDSRPAAARASLLADHNSPVIPVFPATFMINRFTSTRPISPRPTGLVKHDSWITRPELENECRARDFRLVIDHQSINTALETARE